MVLFHPHPLSIKKKLHKLVCSVVGKCRVLIEEHDDVMEKVVREKVDLAVKLDFGDLQGLRKWVNK